MLPNLQMGILSFSEVHFLVIWSSEAAKPGLELQSCALACLGFLSPQTPVVFLSDPCPSFAWKIQLLHTEARWRFGKVHCWGPEHS